MSELLLIDLISSGKSFQILLYIFLFIDVRLLFITHSYIHKHIVIIVIMIIIMTNQMITNKWTSYADTQLKTRSPPPLLTWLRQSYYISLIFKLHHPDSEAACRMNDT